MVLFARLLNTDSDSYQPLSKLLTCHLRHDELDKCPILCLKLASECTKNNLPINSVFILNDFGTCTVQHQDVVAQSF